MYRLGAGACIGPFPELGRRPVFGAFVVMLCYARGCDTLDGSSDALKVFKSRVPELRVSYF